MSDMDTFMTILSDESPINTTEFSLLNTLSSPSSFSIFELL